ncbi:MAG: ATP-dependent helicase [Tenericutes bacterium HGW-Tenericutes-2]|jgi:DNA excision repair protein ERCC-2|nr:MAG: ATP-dependent helicase [Tenericutes bacterium HGW-Tenericutes-2]
MKLFRVGVGELVSFLYSSGDLSSETFQNVSLLEGTKAHQYLQSKYQSTDQAEIPISYTFSNDDLEITLSGRIDGILSIDGALVLEEIKSTRFPIFDERFELNNEHLAQLKMYAYMYMKNNHLDDVLGRVTYIQLSDYKTRHFEFIFDIDLLKDFFESSLIRYTEWLLKLYEHNERKKESLKNLYFPFDQYRRGQREMMAAVYQTMMEDDILYAIAPTGIGKTMASLFATLKSLHEDNQKIFYLSAKTQGKKVALDTMDMLHESGLEMKTLEITSKDTICFLDKRDCDPEKCPFAKGFFDRLQVAMVDIFDHETLMTRDVVERYARKHIVCPFEFSLYVSYFVDVIICDYNYVFDPRSHLIRYFDEDNYKPLILVDEAHNMISRSRDMYSATLVRSDFIKLRRLANKIKPTIRNAVKKVLDQFDLFQEQLELSSFLSFKTLNESFLDSIFNLMKKIENGIKENPKYPKKTDVIEGYLALLGFTRIFEYYNDAYVTNVERLSDDDLSITIQCLDASEFILDTVKNKTYGSVFFSATLYPIEYYKELITCGYGETLKIRSPFDSNRLKLVVMNQISTRYQDRLNSIQQVIETIESVLSSKKGNYIVFFPSYQYMNQVIENLPLDIDADLIVQEREMDQRLRDLIVERFKNYNDQSQLAFFVMGGMFAEGIDYVGDMLNGVIIVGVGLPQLSESNNQLKDYYQEKFSKGFEYAYTYQGMNKVIQAVGRVIRTDLDYGIAILIDDRFNTPLYKKLFPMEWKKYEIINHPKYLKKSLDIFWDKFK